MTSKHDIIIVGGGMAGLTTAIGLARSAFNVAVVDVMQLDDATDEAFDGRSSALAFATCQMLDALGIWKHMEPFAQPILEIRVSDGSINNPSLMHLHFDHTDLGDGPLGHMVENRHTRLALLASLGETEAITLYAPDKVEKIKSSNAKQHVKLRSGQELTAPLLLGIDGRNSQIRKWAGIETSGWGYGQCGIVCSIEHSETHAGIAHERFLPSGPFAILPLTGNRSSLVWTEKDHLGTSIMALSNRAFESEVRRRVGDFLGDVKVIGGRWQYPLTLQYAHSYIGVRMALVGDAAHAIHPIAGQGLNMGLRDVAALIEVLVNARYVGEDIGSGTVLDRYQAWRRFDNTTLAAVTDVLNRLFSNSIPPVRAARDLGLAGINKMPPLKRFFMAHARGTVGKLPKLLRGESPRPRSYPSDL